jgi:type I restriction enzyme, R subunit
MNEADTRAELIEPQLKASGWGVVDGSRILREYHITKGRIQGPGIPQKPLISDFILEYNNRKIATIEAKSDELEVAEGVMQAKQYAAKMEIDYTFAANGREIYQISMKAAEEGLISSFPTPDELWNKTFAEQNEWQARFDAVPFEDVGKTKDVRYYQEIAVNNTMKAIAENKDRILLTLATGTGKTFIAFQIAWKLFQSRWNLKRDGSRRPRILFLADRNILADQAYNAFSAFSEDALVRIKPDAIRKHDRVPTNGSVFFTIFQTFMSGPPIDGEPSPYFGDYPSDFFDFIVIDECHRGGANDEGNWRSIMDYFSPAVQLGLTATPKRKDNVDTYRYFGEPVYIYSLKDGINDGFLTPFKVRRIQTTLDEYVYVSDDKIVEGEVEAGKVYKEGDFNRSIEMVQREEYRVKKFLTEANQNDKSLVFGATQAHAAILRDLINQNSESTDPMYCVRVTANDGGQGEMYLREFQDNEKSIPTILTTSQKLSTGVDARNVRNIVLLRPVNSMIEFKQIIGRGTRLFDGKEYFTIYDFVGASARFEDADWDGEPIAETCDKCGLSPCECEKELPKPCPVCGDTPCVCDKLPPEPCEMCGQRPCVCKKKIKIKLADGKERQIQSMASTSFWDADGKPISAEEFLHKLFGTLPTFFKDEDELRKIWSLPNTRRQLLERLADAGFGKEQLTEMQKVIDAEKSDVFDVLEYVAFAIAPITRAERVNGAKTNIFAFLNREQRDFLDFVLSKYIETGVEELDEAKLPRLLELKYHSVQDGLSALGDVNDIRSTFIDFQKHLYVRKVA